MSGLRVSICKLGWHLECQVSENVLLLCFQCEERPDPKYGVCESVNGRPGEKVCLLFVSFVCPV